MYTFVGVPVFKMMEISIKNHLCFAMELWKFYIVLFNFQKNETLLS